MTLYNEIEPYAADWLENLSRKGLIAPGKVERRSIVDLRAEDVRGLTQFHTFAGIGVWSYALRLAGWPDDVPVWSGSCPCQPFSVAGKGEGIDDERHLWPDWFRLIDQCRPPAIFGEQVASKAGLAWLDVVLAQLEGAGYAVWAADLASAGAGAPHIRQRLFFCALRPEWTPFDVAHPPGGGRVERPWRAGEESVGRAEESGRLGATRGLADDDDGREELRGAGLPAESDAPSRNDADGCSAAGGLVDASSSRGGRDPGAVSGAEGGARRGMRGIADELVAPGAVGRLGHHRHQGLEEQRGIARVPCGTIGAEEGEAAERGAATGGCDAGATRGFWANADWVYCRDNRWRPVEPGTFPLAHGAPARVGRLRAYGNAINAQLAAQFIRSAIEAVRVARMSDP